MGKMIISCLFALALLGGCQQAARDTSSDQPSAESTPTDYAEARRRHEAGDLLGALAAYNEVLDADSSHVGALGNRAILLEGRGQIDAALKDYDRLLQLEPENVPALAHRAALRARTGQLEAAVLDYDAILNLRPDDALIRNDRGFAHYSLGQYLPALVDFERALSIAPDLTPARINRANALYSLNRFRDARAEYETVLLREPHNTAALVAMGNYLLYQEEKEEAAREYYKEALKPESDPEPGARADAWLGLGNLEFTAGRLDEAVSHFGKGLELDPDNLKLRMNRGLAHYRSQSYEEAIADYDYVLARRPDFSSALAMRGYAKCEAGMVTSGCLDLQSAMRKGEEGVKQAIVQYCR